MLVMTALARIDLVPLKQKKTNDVCIRWVTGNVFLKRYQVASQDSTKQFFNFRLRTIRVRRKRGECTSFGTRCQFGRKLLKLGRIHHTINYCPTVVVG